MMVVKLIGSIIVICASGFLGFYRSGMFSSRSAVLRDLQGLLSMFENEINFLSNTIAESFERIYKSTDSPAAVFFNHTVRYLKTDEGLNASQAWEKAVCDNIGMTALTGEDRAILISFGKMLGSSDLEGQIKNIRLALNQLKIQEQKADESRRRNEKMYRSLGILGGIAIVVILI